LVPVIPASPPGSSFNWNVLGPAEECQRKMIMSYLRKVEMSY